jgi:hypothetical protein
VTANTPNFATHIAAIPFNAGGQQASGLLAPMVRAMGHILYAFAAFSDPGYTIPDEEVKRELEHAAGHIASTPAVADVAPISTNAKNYVIAFYGALLCANLEWDAWTADERGTNLRNLANRAAAIAAFFDTEYAGIVASPGSTV